jgi:hypothetical protein
MMGLWAVDEEVYQPRYHPHVPRSPTPSHNNRSYNPKHFLGSKNLKVLTFALQ